MEKNEEFLLEEYKIATQEAQYIEQTIPRTFKNFTLIFLWGVALIVFIVKDDVNANNIFDKIRNHQFNFLIILASFLIILFGCLSILNMLKARYGDVLRTSRINYIRNHFLSETDNEFITTYLNDNRLSQINSIDIYERGNFSWSSDLALFLIPTSLLISIQIIFLFFTFISTNWILNTLITLSVNLIIYFLSRSWLNKNIPNRTSI